MLAILKREGKKANNLPICLQGESCKIKSQKLEMKQVTTDAHSNLKDKDV